jgi:hypothetical protein
LLIRPLLFTFFANIFQVKIVSCDFDPRLPLQIVLEPGDKYIMYFSALLADKMLMGLCGPVISVR